MKLLLRLFGNNLSFEPRVFSCQTAGVVLRSNTLFLDPSLLEESYRFSSDCLFLRPSVPHFLWNTLSSFFRYWGGDRVPQGLKTDRAQFFRKILTLEKKREKVKNESTNDSLTFCGNSIFAKTLSVKLRPKMLLEIQKVLIFSSIQWYMPLFLFSCLRNQVECALRFPFYYIIACATKIILKKIAITKRVCFWQVARGCDAMFTVDGGILGCLGVPEVSF